MNAAALVISVVALGLAVAAYWRSGGQRDVARLEAGLRRELSGCGPSRPSSSTTPATPSPPPTTAADPAALGPHPRAPAAARDPKFRVGPRETPGAYRDALAPLTAGKDRGATEDSAPDNVHHRRWPWQRHRQRAA